MSWFEHAPVAAAHVSSVQTVPASQLTGVPGLHVPLLQVSRPSHRVALSQAVPSATGLLWQTCSAPQTSLVHGLPSLQESPGTHETPDVCWQVPVAGSQKSFVLGFPSSQLGGFITVHAPDTQRSTHRSSQPPWPGTSLSGVCEQPVCGLHGSSVHGLPSSQSSAPSDTQATRSPTRAQVSRPLQIV